MQIIKINNTNPKFIKTISIFLYIVYKYFSCIFIIILPKGQHVIKIKPINKFRKYKIIIEEKEMIFIIDI